MKKLVFTSLIVMIIAGATFANPEGIPKANTRKHTIAKEENMLRRKRRRFKFFICHDINIGHCSRTTNRIAAKS